jgi:hypothetical protein
MRAVIFAAVVLTTAAPVRAQRVHEVVDLGYVTSDPSATTDTMYTATVARARSAFEARQWSCAATLWRSALETDARVAEHWRDYGRALYHEGHHREAVAAFERAMQLGGLPAADGAWEIARSYAWLGNKVQAYRWLARARDAGFHRLDAVREEPAFARYRNDARFESLAEGIERADAHGSRTTMAIE